MLSGSVRHRIWEEVQVLKLIWWQPRWLANATRRFPALLDSEGVPSALATVIQECTQLWTLLECSLKPILTVNPWLDSLEFLEVGIHVISRCTIERAERNIFQPQPTLEGREECVRLFHGIQELRTDTGILLCCCSDLAEGIASFQDVFSLG